MRFICTADWHIRATRPRCRIDEDWIQTQRQALAQVVKISKVKKAPVLVVGDLFHSNSDVSFECIQMIQQMADELGELYILAGNHDLPYHSSENIEKSAIGVLFKSLNIFPIKEYFEKLYYNSGEGINYSAKNFDEQDYKFAHVVFKHTLVFPDAKSIPPNCDGTTAKELLEEFPNAEWIFTGDYHKHFHYEKNGKHVVNSGCLLRQASDFKDYQCGVYFVDTDKNIVEFIPIIDSEQLIDDSYILQENEREERIDNFVQKLKDTESVSLDFLANVENALQNNDLDSELKEVVEELLEV